MSQFTICTMWILAISNLPMASPLLLWLEILVSSPGPFPCYTLKSGRAWYQKSHDLHHDDAKTSGQKVASKTDHYIPYAYFTRLFSCSLKSKMIVEQSLDSFESLLQVDREQQRPELC